MLDVYNDALNAPAGRLAEVLIRKVTKGDGSELSDDVLTRLDRLIDAPALRLCPAIPESPGLRRGPEPGGGLLCQARITSETENDRNVISS
jgi:hypothetical protein